MLILQESHEIVRFASLRTDDDQMIIKIGKNNKNTHAVCHLRDIDARFKAEINKIDKNTLKFKNIL